MPAMFTIQVQHYYVQFLKKYHNVKTDVFWDIFFQLNVIHVFYAYIMPRFVSEKLNIEEGKEHSQALSASNGPTFLPYMSHPLTLCIYIKLHLLA